MQKLVNYYGYYNSPIGLIKVTVRDNSIVSLIFINQSDELAKNHQLLTIVNKQLDAYFQQKLTIFELPLQLIGTTFQQKVWTHLLTTKHGETITYQELAVQLGKPTAARAVGNAVAKNPLSIIIPCHRVIATNQTKINYRWGKQKKLFLLQLEKNNENK